MINYKKITLAILIAFSFQNINATALTTALIRSLAKKISDISQLNVTATYMEQLYSSSGLLYFLCAMSGQDDTASKKITLGDDTSDKYKVITNAIETLTLKINSKASNDEVDVAAKKLKDAIKDYVKSTVSTAVAIGAAVELELLAKDTVTAAAGTTPAFATFEDSSAIAKLFNAINFKNSNSVRNSNYSDAVWILFDFITQTYDVSTNKKAASSNPIKSDSMLAASKFLMASGFTTIDESETIAQVNLSKAFEGFSAFYFNMQTPAMNSASAKMIAENCQRSASAFNACGRYDDAIKATLLSTYSYLLITSALISGDDFKNMSNQLSDEANAIEGMSNLSSTNVKGALLKTSLIFKIAQIAKLIDAIEVIGTVDVNFTQSTEFNAITLAVRNLISDLNQDSKSTALNTATIAYLKKIFVTVSGIDANYPVLNLIDKQATAGTPTSGVVKDLDTAIANSTQAATEYLTVATSIQTALSKASELSYSNEILTDLCQARALALRLAALYESDSTKDSDYLNQAITCYEDAVKYLKKINTDESNSLANVYLSFASSMSDRANINSRQQKNLIEKASNILSEKLSNLSSSDLNSASSALINSTTESNSSGYTRGLEASSMALSLASITQNVMGDAIRLSDPSTQFPATFQLFSSGISDLNSDVKKIRSLTEESNVIYRSTLSLENALYSNAILVINSLSVILKNVQPNLSKRFETISKNLNQNKYLSVSQTDFYDTLMTIISDFPNATDARYVLIKAHAAAFILESAFERDAKKIANSYEGASLAFEKISDSVNARKYRLLACKSFLSIRSAAITGENFARAGANLIKIARQSDGPVLLKAISYLQIACSIASLLKNYAIVVNTGSEELIDLCKSISELSLCVNSGESSLIEKKAKAIESNAKKWMSLFTGPNDIISDFQKAIDNLTITASSDKVIQSGFYDQAGMILSKSIDKISTVTLEDSNPRAQLLFASGHASLIAVLHAGTVTTSKDFVKIAQWHFNAGQSFKDGATQRLYSNDKDDAFFNNAKSAESFLNSGDNYINATTTTSVPTEKDKALYYKKAGDSYLQAGLVYDAMKLYDAASDSFKKALNSYHDSGNEYKTLNMNFEAGEMYDQVGFAAINSAISLKKAEKNSQSKFMFEISTTEFLHAAEQFDASAVSIKAQVDSSSNKNIAKNEIAILYDRVGQSYMKSGKSYENRAKSAKNSEQRERASDAFKIAGNQLAKSADNFDSSGDNFRLAGFNYIQDTKIEFEKADETYNSSYVLYAQAGKTYKDLADDIISSGVITTATPTVDSLYIKSQNSYIYAAYTALKVAVANSINGFSANVVSYDIAMAANYLMNALKRIDPKNSAGTSLGYITTTDSSNLIKALLVASSVLHIASAAHWVGLVLDTNDVLRFSGDLSGQKGLKQLLDQLIKSTQDQNNINTAADDLFDASTTFLNDMTTSGFNNYGDGSISEQFKLIVTAFSNRSMTRAISKDTFITAAEIFFESTASILQSTGADQNAISEFYKASATSYYTAALIETDTKKQLELFKKSSDMFNNSLITFEEAAVIYNNANDHVGSAISYNHAGITGLQSAVLEEKIKSAADIAGAFEIAGVEFDNSAVNYGISGDHIRSIDSFKSAANAYKKSGDRFKEANNLKRAADNYYRSTLSVINLATSIEDLGYSLLSDIDIQNLAISLGLEIVRLNAGIGAQEVSKSLSEAAKIFDKLYDFSKSQEYHLESARKLLEISPTISITDVDFSNMARQLFKAIKDDKSDSVDIKEALYTVSAAMHCVSAVKSFGIQLDFSNGQAQAAFGALKLAIGDLIDILRKDFVTDFQKNEKAKNVTLGVVDFIHNAIVFLTKDENTQLAFIFHQAAEKFREKEHSAAAKEFNNGTSGVFQNNTIAQLLLASSMSYLSTAFTNVSPEKQDSASFNAGATLNSAGQSLKDSGYAFDAVSVYEDAYDAYTDGNQSNAATHALYKAGEVIYSVADSLRNNDETNEAYAMYDGAIYYFKRAASEYEASKKYSYAARAYQYIAISNYYAEKISDAIEPFANAAKNFNKVVSVLRMAGRKNDAIIAQYYEGLSYYYSALSLKTVGYVKEAETVFENSVSLFNEAAYYFYGLANALNRDKKYASAGSSYNNAAIAFNYAASSWAHFAPTSNEARNAYTTTSSVFDQAAEAFEIGGLSDKANASRESAAAARDAVKIIIVDPSLMVRNGFADLKNSNKSEKLSKEQSNELAKALLLSRGSLELKKRNGFKSDSIENENIDSINRMALAYCASLNL